MSIFRETLYSYVQEQLNTRTEVISTTDVRSAPFLAYTTGKNGWVRLASFVNYDDPKGRYSGDQLAKKYILEGGTLKRTGDEESLRFGIGSSNSAYLSDLDGFNSKGQAPGRSNPLFSDFRQLGARPMPGITSVDIVNKSAYGSLKEATVKYYCWDKHQLEELELLYMRTGYTVLLEWGWSQYLESKNKISNIGQGIDIFNRGLTDDIIYNRIEELRQKYKGNYDALLGHIKNFSWQLLPNGGYECTTVLISRGEIISTLRLSSNSFEDSATSGQRTDAPLSTFERVFLNYKAWINNLEIDKVYLEKNKSDKDEDKANKFSKSPQEFKPIYNSETETDVENPVNETSVDNFIKELETRISNIPSFSVYGYSSKGNWLPDNYTLSGKAYWNSINKSKGVAIVCDAGAEDGTAIEYIRLDHFLVILNTYFNLKSENNELISKINIPQFVPCLASEDSVSIDPRVCLIRNPNAKFITDTDLPLTDIDTNYKGFQPYTITEFDYLPDSNQRLRTSNRDIMYPFHLSDSKNLGAFVPESKKFSFGSIDNIYVSLNKIIEIYRSKGGGNPDGVLIVDYLKDLLSQISSALGGINDFQLHVEKDQIKIIDVKYLEVEAGNKSNKFGGKYEFDLLGLKSICRDVRITSRIFDSQATMISIAAQNKNNIGDIYSSTQNYFNRGLTDRLLPSKIINKGTPDDKSSNDDQLDYYVRLWNSLSSIAYYLREKCIGIPVNNNLEMGDIKVPNDADVNNAKSIVKTIHYQINGYDVDYKAIIPFELELTLDGIGGLVVGQIFTINKSILPRDYVEKNIGFIITGISHSLQNNDWVTNIKTQVCLLDQETLAKEFSFSKGQKEKIKEALIKIKTQATKNQFLAYAITDFLYEKLSYVIYDVAPSDMPYKTYDLGLKFAVKNYYYSRDGRVIKVPQTKFTNYIQSWIDNVKTKYSNVYNYELFPKSSQEMTSYTLDETQKVPYQFNDDLPDRAFSSYGYFTPGQNLQVTLQGDYLRANVLSDFNKLNPISIQDYFSLKDPYSNSDSFQSDYISARNSSLTNNILRFNEQYCNEFQGNIAYVNSIFGRGLTGTIDLTNGNKSSTIKFNLENQEDNSGLSVNAKSKNIETSNYKDGDVFKIRGNTSVLAGSKSGIEKYLSSLIINNNSIERISNPPKQELWDKIFEYVTKDLLSTSGGLQGMSKEIADAFQFNPNIQSQIKGLNLNSIYFK